MTSHTPNAQDHDCQIFEAQYIGNGARVVVNGPPIGNHALWVL